MLNIKKNQSLKTYNTFGVEATAKYFLEINTEAELQEFLAQEDYKNENLIVIGEGSNLLITKDIDGVVLKLNIKGIRLIKESVNTVYVEAMAGEKWDDLVKWTVERNFGGMENMALIPGTVGGAVSQNIAAYGQNISDVIEEVTAVDRSTSGSKIYTAKDCEYTYRSSIFKDKLQGKIIITKAVFRLKKNPAEFELNYHERKGRYASLAEAIEKVAKPPYNIKDVMNAVIYSRLQRLPDTSEFGSCGSFFKNPIVTREKYNELALKISDLQSYPVDKLLYSKKEWGHFAEGEELVKIPIARLFDELGYNGKWEKNVGVFQKHALCVISNKKASGKEILDFAMKMRRHVKDVYDVDVEFEVCLI